MLICLDKLPPPSWISLLCGRGGSYPFLGLRVVDSAIVIVVFIVSFTAKRCIVILKELFAYCKLYDAPPPPPPPQKGEMSSYVVLYCLYFWLVTIFLFLLVICSFSRFITSAGKMCFFGVQSEFLNRWWIYSHIPRVDNYLCVLFNRKILLLARMNNCIMNYI